MMATCSVDEYVKVWDIGHNNGTEPKLISYKKMSAMGELFSLSFYKDIPWVLAAGGSKGEVAVWDTEENESIAKHFEPTLDKTTFAENGAEEEEEEEDMSDDGSSDGEERKKPKKTAKASAAKQGKVVDKKKQIKQLNKISEGIQKIREMKKSQGK